MSVNRDSVPCDAATTIRRVHALTIVAQSGKVFQAGRYLQAVKPDLCLSCETGEFPDVLAAGKAFGPAVPVAHYHPFCTCGQGHLPIIKHKGSSSIHTRGRFVT
jgi:hypothetical protein